jgi:cell filamentation protein
MSEDPYVYPGTEVLKNKLGLTDFEELDRWEREYVVKRFRDGAPTGKFDLKHLRAIHHHLFQDIYEWAGQLREVEISKGGSQFMFRKFIDTGMADVQRRLTEWKFLRGLSEDAFAEKAGEIIGDINHIHPFREGNGRTQMTYLMQLTQQAGHQIDVRKIQREAWYEASRASHSGNFTLMGAAIRQALV